MEEQDKTKIKESIEGLTKPFEYNNVWYRCTPHIKGKRLLTLTRITNLFETKELIQKATNTNDETDMQELAQNKELQVALTSQVLLESMEKNYNTYLSFIEISVDGGNNYKPIMINGVLQNDDVENDITLMSKISLLLYASAGFFIANCRK